MAGRVVEVIVEPTAEPITLAEGKTHLRVRGGLDDGYITDLIRMARVVWEDRAEQALVTRTLRLHLDRFPFVRRGEVHDPEEDDAPGRVIRLEYPPLVSVTQIDYTDTDGAPQMMASADFDVDTKQKPGRVCLAESASWPNTKKIPNAVSVLYVAGVGAPADLKIKATKALHAIKMILSHFYENREPVVVGTIVAPIPDSLDSLLWLDTIPTVA